MSEALLITLAATVAGTVAAGLVLRTAQSWSALPMQVDTPTLAIPLLTGLVLGTTFSYWPARAAARISPSEALRNE